MQILALLPFAILFTAIAGWVTHIVWSITTLLGDVAMTVNQGAIAIIGAIIPPLGAIHGVYLWF
jgi:hypothetical protein